MHVTVGTLQAMIDLLSDRMGYPPDFSGLRMMSEELELQNSDYLYKKVHVRIKDHPHDELVKLGDHNLNVIAKYLRFKSFYELERALLNITPQLKSIAGSFYSYVRANLSEATLYRSPVRIFDKDGKMWFELKGPKIQYKGELKAQKGCAFVLMTSREGKFFHHIYKIGARLDPDVLQGVFSGVSTAFDPIGGRTVLVRQKEEWPKLKNAMIPVASLKRSKDNTDKALITYFKDSKNNNLALNRSATFSADDLN